MINISNFGRGFGDSFNFILLDQKNVCAKIQVESIETNAIILFPIFIRGQKCLQLVRVIYTRVLLASFLLGLNL